MLALHRVAWCSPCGQTGSRRSPLQPPVPNTATARLSPLPQRHNQNIPCFHILKPMRFTLFLCHIYQRTIAKISEKIGNSNWRTRHAAVVIFPIYFIFFWKKNKNKMKDDLATQLTPKPKKNQHTNTRTNCKGQQRSEEEASNNLPTIYTRSNARERARLYILLPQCCCLHCCYWHAPHASRGASSAAHL